MFRPTWIIIWLTALLSATLVATLRSGPSADGLRSTSDWPMYKHDAQRSGVSAEALSFPLQPAWTYVSPQPPAPAWPDTFPQALLNRMDFDYAPQLAIAEGIVCFGSSADDTVRALDLGTGREKWHFITGGPVRFAPQIISNRVYFASDDGYVYCLNAQTGRGIWKLNLAPADERFVGNHRMISRWPVRTGVLVADGVVYAAAGMWPAEGIFIYALRADTGKVLWCNDTVGGMPQGALLLGGDVLLIPNGNARTTPLDRHTGELMRWGSSNDPPGWLAGSYESIPADPRTGAPAQLIYRGGGSGRGGTWVTVDDDNEYNFVMHRANQLDIEPYSLTNGLAGRGWRVSPQISIEAIEVPGYVHARGKVSAIVHKGRSYTRQAYGMALAGNTLFLGHDGAVAAQSATNTSEIWRAEVKGEARELAVAEGHLFVATSEGMIYAFAPGHGVDAASSPRALRGAESVARKIVEGGGRTPPAINQPSPPKADPPMAETINHLQSAGMDRGFALVLGDSDGQMSLALAAQTQLQVVNALTDASAVTALRERLLATTAWHGSRIHVQHVARLDALPFAQYFANAVIVANQTTGLSGKELYRVLRPCGGIMLFPGLSTAQTGKLIAETGASESEARATQKQTPSTEHRTLNTAPAVVRGKLPDSLDWDQEPGGISRVRGGADQRVKWPLRLLWFGGPSTRQVQNNIQGYAGSVPANGRFFTLSERALTAVDAYNGAVLWSRPIPKANPGVREVDGVLYRASDSASGRPDRARGLRVDNESVYLVLGQEFFVGKGERPVTIQLDARTGEQQKIYGPFNAPTPVVSLKTAQTWPLAANSNQPGLVAMESTARGLVLTLTTQDASVTPLDAWELYFDFRPVEARYGLYERGTFHIRVTPARDPAGGGAGAATPATWSPITAWSSCDPTAVAGENGPRSPSAATAGSAMPASVGRHSMTAPSATATAAGTTPLYPQIEVSGTRDANGTKTLVTLPWTEIQKLIGVKPSSLPARGGASGDQGFDFAATLNAHDGPPAAPAGSGAGVAQAGGRESPIVRRHLFGNWAADGINNGWARIILHPAGGGTGPAGGGAGATSAAGGTNVPAIMGSGAPGGNHGPAGWGQTADPLVLNAPGTHPLTGEPVPKIYGIAPVCGGAYASAHIISQAGGLYDLAENSGRRPCYPGVKTGCTTPQKAALGLFIISEEWGHCVCNYPFRGTLALAPAERRLNEDWASFYDRDVDTRVRQAYINLGAPGDRRDEKGNLWLGFPRSSELRTQEEYPSIHHPLPYPLGMRDVQVGLWPRRPIRSVLWLPLEVEVLTNFGPYRFSADRASIKGTDRPWIYASGYRGITKATMKLNFFKPLVSLPASTVDKPDGRDGARPSTAAAAAITVDGKLDEAAWGSEFQSTSAAQRATSAAERATSATERATSATPALPYTLTRVAFRHDSGNLYVGIKRPPMTVVKRTPTSGADAAFNYEPVPWRTTTNSEPDKISNGDNWWRLIVSDASPAPGGTGARKALYLTVMPNGTRAEALQDGTTNALNQAWNGSWQSAVVADTNGMTLEMAIPWATLAEAGLNKDQLAVNFLMNDPGIGTEALTYLGLGGADRCSNFTPLGLGKPAAVPTRAFTVRLHFAEPDDVVKPGQRVFDVKLQGQTVLKNFDIVKEAGAVRKALVKEFPHVAAAEVLTIEFKPRAAAPLDGRTAPILCGLELAEESGERPKL